MILCRYQHDMDPYACCYCGVTKQTQKQIVEHTIQEHPTNEVKLRKCELSTSTEKCGYRTLNFKIIPSELESLGKKVCVDDHGSVFTKAVIVNSPTTASPAHKKVKQENKLSPKAKQNPFENVDVGDISETFGIGQR